MKKLILIENAKELFDFSNRVRAEGSDTPCLPSDATLVFENDMETVQLQKAGNFVLSDEVNAHEIVCEAIKRGGIKLHVT